MHQQQRNRRRCHARNTLRLANGLRAHTLQLLQCFSRQTTHRAEVETLDNSGVLMPLLALDLVALAVQITGVLDADFHLLGHARIIDARSE